MEFLKIRILIMIGMTSNRDLTISTNFTPNILFAIDLVAVSRNLGGVSSMLGTQL